VVHVINKTASRAKSILKCVVSRDNVLLTRAFCTFVRHIFDFSHY
jgi:hypothetical protein